MKDNLTGMLFLLLAAIPILIGAYFGFISLVVIIPIVCIALYIAHKRGALIDSNVVIGALVVVAILVGFGSCVRSCSDNDSGTSEYIEWRGNHFDEYRH